MIKLSAFLTLACVSCAPVPAVAIEMEGDNKVFVTPEERHKLTQCHRQGGCYVVTQAEVDQAVHQVRQQAFQEAAVFTAAEVKKAAESCRRSGT